MGFMGSKWSPTVIGCPETPAEEGENRAGTPGGASTRLAYAMQNPPESMSRPNLSLLSPPRLHRFALPGISCLALLLTAPARSAEKTIAGELDAVVEVAEQRMKEGTASMVDLLKVRIAANFARYKAEAISSDEWRKRNAPLEIQLMSMTRALYQQKEVSTDDLVATIDFIAAHR